MLFLSGLIFVFVTSGYSKDTDFYKEFRFRIERAKEKEKPVMFEKNPPVSINKTAFIILESRNVGRSKGFGHGSWKKVRTFEAHVQSTDRDVENVFFNSPTSWVEDGYIVYITPTADNRKYWWDENRMLHFYAVYKKIK
jgi:hypothetical protein